jgi:hypothetical protein
MTAATLAALAMATWRKSSRSQGGGAECVEVAHLGVAPGGALALRDSKDAQGPCLIITARAARDLITTIKEQASERW